MSNVPRGVQSILLNINEAAETLRVSRSTIKRLIGENKLRPTRIGRRVLISAAALDELVQSAAE
jgi:excisionase family DNA binding protein